MHLNKILFPTDLSSTSQQALEMAASLARDSEAEMLIVHVEEPAIAYGGGEMYFAAADEIAGELKQALTKIQPRDDRVRVRHRLITGEPAHAVVRLAKEEKIDLIVMGSHGRTGLSRLLMGSVAEEVVRHAECPVLIYKQPKRPEDAS